VLGEIPDVWNPMETDLAQNDVHAAAGRLRRHLEYVATELADSLAAKVGFRGDGGYDMGELLGAVIGRQRELLNRAAKGGEEWILNAAIHYNAWADFSREDFESAVSAFRGLLQQFRCEKPKCGSWLYVSPRHNPQQLRCACGALHVNLKEK
jgi:hypothetical protein